MKHIFRVLPIIVLIVMGHFSTIAQKKYDKLLQKADSRYEYGDYKKALKYLISFEHKIKKLGDNSKYHPQYYVREARFYLASGLLSGFSESLDKAQSSAVVAFGENSENHLEIMLEISDVYIMYGNYQKALSYSNQVLANWKEQDHSEALKARAELNYATILSAQGFYQEALKFITDRDPYFKSRLGNRDVIVDDAGNEDKIKLKEKEIIARHADYAHLLSLKAKTLGSMGEIEKAYTAYEFARDWIADEKKFLGDQSYEYIEHQFAFANFKVENGLDPEELGRGDHKEEGYNRILNNLQRGHDTGHILAFDIFETILKQYLINQRHSRYRDKRIEYEKAISKNFSKNSLHYINLQKLDFNSRL